MTLQTNLEPITVFDGEYRFLSNFYEVDIYYWDNMSFWSAEHAYQYMKCGDRDGNSKGRIMMARTPGEAKRIGQKIPLRRDWEYMKLYVMLKIVRRKFDNRALANQLLLTGHRELIEGNSWGDMFWGMCGSSGHNHLGKILMIVRDELRETEE